MSSAPLPSSDAAAPAARMCAWRPRLLTLLRWNLLIDAALAVWFARMTASKSPAWLPWEVGMVVPEIALWLAAFPLAVAVVAGLVGRGHRVMTGLTLCLCATTLVLLLKPTVQARSLDINVFHSQSQMLADKLAAAAVPHALVSLPWAAHAFDLVRFNSPGGQIATLRGGLVRLGRDAVSRAGWKPQASVPHSEGT